MSVFSQSTADQIGIAISPGESFSLHNAPLSPTRKAPLTLPSVFKSSLPPAVTTVPPDHIRGYVHHKKVNHYLVGSTLGEGSFAKVKEAFHVLVGEKVAMKIIDKKKAQQDPYVAKNFKREAKLLQMVRHPNILQLLEVIETDSSFYLITELCSGGELMKYIYKKGHLDENETRKFMRQIVSAVDHLHKAGIIHRDLKVENMLLDSNMDIKLIDFGLSNEEYVQGENGRMHCNTQCGSPAYAAPELLGHKSYGPQVDIWSIGVNMYAMLTGCLPYTVEPFNITALHAKMLENKMNPIPDHLSANCKDLLKRLLKSNPDERIKMSQIMDHPWMNEGHTLPFGPAPFPNRLQLLDINNDIIQHMVHHLKLKDTEDNLKQEIAANRSTQSAAIYYLLSARLARYKKQFQPRIRHRSTKVSRDQGFFEGDDDDVQSVISMPTKLRKGPHQNRNGGVQLRQKHPKADKRRPISHPEIEAMREQEVDEMETIKEQESFARYNRMGRRKTMPEISLEEDLAKFREYQSKKGEEVAVTKNETTSPSKQAGRPVTRQHNFPPDTRQRSLSVSQSGHQENRQRKITPPSIKHQPSESRKITPPKYQSSENRITPPSHHEQQQHGFHNTSPEHSILGPAHHMKPPKSLKRNHYSTPNTLNQLRQDLAKELGDTAVKQAWRSNPASRTTSRNPSRQGSRHPSGRLGKGNSTSGIHSRTASLDIDDSLSDMNELVFHPVKSNTLPRPPKNKFTVGSPTESIVDTSAHLPSIVESTAPRRRTYSESTTKNGYVSQTGTYEVKTYLAVTEVLAEITRVAHSLTMREVEQIDHNTVSMLWSGMKIEVSVSKEFHHSRISFRWISGGNLASYKEKCDKIIEKIKL